MLKTIYTIGKEISQGRDIWEDIIEQKLEPKKEGLRQLVLNIIFDLDEKEIIISKDNYAELDRSYNSRKDLMHLKTLGRNMKSPYLCVDYKKIENLSKALFGKADKKTGLYPQKGDLIQAVEGEFPELLNQPLFEILPRLINFRLTFEEIFKNKKGKFTLEKVNELLEISKKNKIILIYPSVKSKELSIKNQPLASFEGYADYLKKKYLESNFDGNLEEKLCYATGEFRENIQEPNFSGRYNINKLFVQETKNYAPSFDSKKFNQNYQISEEIQSYLNRGSDYVLNSLVTTIADVRHVIIPQFLNSKKITRKRLKSILSDTDLLFNFKKLSELQTYFEHKSQEDAYWLNFMAIDSDGNYFKAGNLIKDVSQFHFINLINALRKAGELLSPWLGKKYAFNLNRVYRLIPVRKDKENVNQALILFATILEGRKVESKKIYQHFTELVLCHWYERYKSFTNVNKFYADVDFALKDAVFGYLAFFKTLKKLNLIKNQAVMDKKTVAENIAKEVSNFFDAMDYKPEQQALFYLGRALNQAAYAQQKRGNKKAVLEKINYNGMDRRSIYRLSTDLFEKGKQYDVLEKMQRNLGRFNKGFDFNNWNTNPQEALFFILSGYTFGIKTKLETDSESDTENE